jgi:hypothetical protein
MTCRPGELAVVIATRPEAAHYLHMPVTVIRVDEIGSKHLKQLCWIVSPPLLQPNGKPYVVQDKALKPIRPPKMGEVTENTREREAA